MYRQAEASGCLMPLKVSVSVLKCLLEMNESELAGRVVERVVGALRNGDHFDDLKSVFQVFYEHDMTDKILALYGATEARAGKFDNVSSEYIVAALMKNQARLREVSLEKLDLVFPSVLQLLTLSVEDLRSGKIMPALLRMNTVPSSLDFHKILMKVYGKLGFRDFWACFRHFAELGAEVFQQTIDMVDSWEDLNSYEDTLFIMALARDAGLEVPADLYSVALVAALNIGNFGDALALHDEMESLKLKASAQAEQKYKELLVQANEMNQTLRNRKRMQQIRTRSRAQRGQIHTYFSDPSFTQSCSVLESSL